MRIWTETPTAEMWQQLRYLTRPANVYNLITGITESGRNIVLPESEDTRDRTVEIASCIRQADEYFQASDSVSLATKPLVQFYGVQALAKAAILALDNQTRLVDLRYHGLSTRSSTTGEPQASQLRLYSENPNSWTLEDEYAITNDGVFPHISAIAGESVRNKGHVLKLKPLLRVVPEFGQLYERHYGEQHHTLYLYGEPKLDQHGQFEIIFSVAKHDDILAVFPEFGNGFTEVLRHNNPGFGFAGSIQDTPNFGKVVKGTIAGKYFVRPTQDGLYTSLSVLYALSFILSNVVRYKPAFWISLLEGRQTGSASFVEAVTNLVRRRFPNDVLESIWGEEFVYMIPSYFS